MKRTFFITAAAVIFVAAISFDLHAQQASEGNPCMPDIKTFCKSVKPGEGRIARCLKQHENELSEAWRDYRAGLKERAKAGTQACEADMAKFCKSVKPGEGRIVQCLKQHENELSEACRKYLVRK